MEKVEKSRIWASWTRFDFRGFSPVDSLVGWFVECGDVVVEGDEDGSSLSTLFLGIYSK